MDLYRSKIGPKKNETDFYVMSFIYLTQDECDRFKYLVEMDTRMPAQKTEAWLQFRQFRVTGSEVGTVLGHNPYQSRDALLLRKLGHDPSPFHGNEATRHGEYWEPKAVELYEEQTGFQVVAFNIIPHRDFSTMAYSPDGLAIRVDEYTGETELRLIEIKCPFRRDICGRVPRMYLDQVQMGLEVLRSYGLDNLSCDFIQFKPAHLHTPYGGQRYDHDTMDGLMNIGSHFGHSSNHGELRWTPSGLLRIQSIQRDPRWMPVAHVEITRFIEELLRFQACPERHPSIATQQYTSLNISVSGITTPTTPIGDDVKDHIDGNGNGGNLQKDAMELQNESVQENRDRKRKRPHSDDGDE